MVFDVSNAKYLAFNTPDGSALRNVRWQKLLYKACVCRFHE